MSVIYLNNTNSYNLSMIFTQKSLNRRKFKRQHNISDVNKNNQIVSENITNSKYQFTKKFLNFEKTGKKVFDTHKKDSLLCRSKSNSNLYEKIPPVKSLSKSKSDKVQKSLSSFRNNEETKILCTHGSVDDLRNYQRNIIYMLNDIMANAECRKYFQDMNA